MRRTLILMLLAVVGCDIGAPAPRENKRYPHVRKLADGSCVELVFVDAWSERQAIKIDCPCDLESSTAICGW